MPRILIAAILLFSFASSDLTFAQGQEEDVIVLKDSTIVRGKLTETVTPGGAVTIKKNSGKVSSFLWSEIRAIKRLPVNLPDSSVVALFLGAGPGNTAPAGGAATISGGYSSTFAATARDTTEEDVLILTDGQIVRGSIVESAQKGAVGIWKRDQKLAIYKNSEIDRKLHVEKAMTDSVIDVMYIHPLPEMLADDHRIVTIFGGLSVAAGEFARPSNDGGDPAGSGYAVGIHASVRILPSIRWATTAIYSENSLDVPAVLGDYSASASADPYRLIWVVTGGEIRTEGTAMMKAFAFVQGGILFSRISAFTANIPQTVNHPAGSGGQGGASASSFAFSIGGGVTLGRFSLMGRWLVSTPSYDYMAMYDFGSFYGGQRIADYRFDQQVNVIHVCIGFSPF